MRSRGPAVSARTVLIHLVVILMAFFALDAYSQRQRAVRRPVPDLSDLEVWLNVEGIRLLAAEPSGPSWELNPLSDWTAGSKVIGLADGSHGSSEFYTFKHRLIEHLVATNGLRIIAIEGPWPEFAELSAIARGDDSSDPREVLDNDSWWFWNTEEIARLVEWARDYNLTHPDQPPVEFRGVDPFVPTSLIEMIGSFGERYLSDVEPSFRERIRCLENWSTYGSRSDAYQSSCLEEIESVHALLLSRRDQLESSAGRVTTWEIIEAARMLIQAEATSRLGAAGVAKRDGFMAENVERLSAGAGDDPVVFWAHASHVMALPSVPPEMNADFKPVGRYLRENLGDAYFAIGMTAIRGRFNRLTFWRGHEVVAPAEFEEPGAESFERFFLDRPATLIPLGNPHPQLLAPLNYNLPAASGFIRARISVPGAYDAVVVFPEVRPTEYFGPPELNASD